MNDSTTGERVRRLRKLRGLTQQDLARLSRRSLRTIKDVEADHGSHRNETLHAIAKGLQVRTTDLTSPGQPEHQPVPGEPWEDVRDALYRRTASPEPDEPATPAGVLAGVGALKPDWEAARYSKVRLLLPGLVRDALSLDADDPGARVARATALTATAALLTMTRQFDDAMAAGRLALDAAPDLHDSAAAIGMLTWCLLRQGRTEDARNMAVDWADRAEPRFSRATTVQLVAYGRLMLYVANAMASDNQPGEAQDALSLARAAAARLGREVPFHAGSTGMFGPTTVAVIAAEAAALTWQPDKVLSIAERVRGGITVIEPAQQLRHKLDVANARVMRREYDEAVAIMRAIQAEAPEWLPAQQYARDILESLVSKRRGPAKAAVQDLAEAIHLAL